MWLAGCIVNGQMGSERLVNSPGWLRPRICPGPASIPRIASRTFPLWVAQKASSLLVDMTVFLEVQELDQLGDENAGYQYSQRLVVDFFEQVDTTLLKMKEAG